MPNGECGMERGTLEQRSGISIDHDPPRPPAERPHDTPDGAWLRCLHEHMPPPAPFDPLDRARRRPEHIEGVSESLAVHSLEPGRHTHSNLPRAIRILVSDHEPCEPDVGRVGRTRSPA